jgi:2-keto-4-pentenoate hydratase
LIAVERLLEARRSRRPIELLSDELHYDVDTAYDVQRRLLSVLGGSARGYKIAMTSAETQALVGAHEPAYGVLLAEHILSSPARISLAEANRPMLEPELMLIPGADLPLSAGEAEVIAACDVAAGLEVPDARYRDWFGRQRLTDLISDDCATGWVVVASRRRPAAELDLASVHMRLFRDERLVGEADSSVVMGSPARAVAWLAKSVAVPAGCVISSGTFLMPVPAEPGVYRVEYEGIGEASVTVMG